MTLAIPATAFLKESGENRSGPCQIRTNDPRGGGLSFVSRSVIVPAVYGLGFCAYEGHPLGRCSLPSRDMLELRQPLTNLEKALPRISFERRKPVQRVADCEVV